MKIRFWQKTYILTMILFLLCLYVGIFSLAFYSYQRNMQNVENACLAEQNYIAMSFERDYNDMVAAGRGTNPLLLMDAYGAHYEKQQIYLKISVSDAFHYSSFERYTPDPSGNTIMQTRIDKERYILISSEICDGQGALIYGKSIAYLDQEFATLVTTYVIVAAVLSVFLAVVLLIILKKLSLPLENLQKVTDQLSCGDMTVMADESGNDEFALLGKSFNQMVHTIRTQMDDLEKDAKQKQMLVDNMAHEMRTPLTSIRGYAEYIEKAAVPEPEKADSARRIMSEADRLRKISEKILDTACLRENPIEKVPVNLASLLQDIAEKLSSVAHNRDVTMMLDGVESSIEGDEVLLSMLFYNLTENAIKACSKGGTVTLFCDSARVIISDNGKGMTAEQLSHIREPFYRTDKSRSRAEGGAGLGLALCQQIVDSHGAHMTFESELHVGTNVYVDFRKETSNEKCD